MNEPYIPTESDKSWAQNMVNILKDGGVWGIPRSNVILKIEKKEKTLTQISGPTEGRIFEKEVYLNTPVFEAIGYKVIWKERDAK